MSLGTIGSYEVIASLGSGARGSVYRARHATFGRIAAIKHLVASVSDDSAEYQRLLDEVERLKSVPARHVAAIMSVELVDGRPLIEMESLGEGLDRALRQQPLDSREALRAVMDILSGLRDMHAAGIVHANLKPSNVLQDTTNRSWKISDGGLTGIESHSAPTLLATSVLYVAPEMLAAVPRSDERSDLYSVGMVGLEAMLGGGLLDAFPKLARSATPSRWLSWLEDTGTDAAPLHELRPEVLIEVSEFFARLLSKNPDRRFQSAAEALEAMEALLPIVAASQPSPAPRTVEMPPVRPTPVPPSLATPSPVPLSTPTPTMIGTPSPSSRPVAVTTPVPRATPAPKAAPSGTQLVVTGPNGFEERFALGDRTLRIGRDAKNDIVLPDDTKAISRMHAEIRREQGRYVMVDLDSQNGLWIGGRRKSSIPLAAGGAIKIGDYTLTVGGDTLASRVAVAKPATAATPAVRTRAAMVQLAAVVRTWWPPSSPRHWAVIGAIAAVLVAGVTWAAWPKGPSAEEIARQQQEQEREQQRQEQHAREEQEKLRLQKDQEAADAVAARLSRLEAAGGFLKNKEWQSAIDQVTPILASNAADDEALAIRKQAEEGLQAELKLSAKNPTKGTAGVTNRKTGAPEGRGQTPPPTDPVAERQRQLAGMYERAAAIPDGEQALAAWLALMKEDASYRDVANRVANLRKTVVDAHILEARKFESSDKLVNARNTYLRARAIHPESSEVQRLLNDLANRMKKDGDASLTLAILREGAGRKEEAKSLFQKATEYLLPDDPNWQRAKAGLDRLK